MRRRSMDDAFINTIVFISALGMIFLISVIILLARVEAKRRRDLDLHGRTVIATITSIRGDDLSGYSATAEWRNPRTGATSSFQGSGSYSIGTPVEVVFDPGNSSKCYFRRVTTEDRLRLEQAYQGHLKGERRFS